VSDIKQTLLKEAQALRASSPELVAIGLLKQAGLSDEDARAAVAQELIEKEACSALVGKGFDPEEAVKLVKAANVSVEGLMDETPEEKLASLLEKAAEQMQAMEDQIVGLGAEVEHVKQASDAALEQATRVIPEPISRLAIAGQFTNDDLEALMALPETVLTKVAAAAEEPWGMGKAAGFARPVEVDPLTQFLMS